MTNSGSSPEPKKEGLKALIVKGAVGAAALVGTTSIPILVKQAIEKPPEPIASPSVPAVVSTPTPASSPTGATPPTVVATPATMSPNIQSTTVVPDPQSSLQTQPVMEGTVVVPYEEEPHGKKHKKKGKKD